MRFDRRICAAALAATIALGLLSRRYPLPGVFAEYTGDALYAVAAFWALAVLRPASQPWQLALAAWAASALVELSQLAQPAWLVAARATVLGGLVLGHGFKHQDLLAYGCGAGIAWALVRNHIPAAAPVA